MNRFLSCFVLVAWLFLNLPVNAQAQKWLQPFTKQYWQSKQPSQEQIVAWFQRYDQIRREAQMSPAERKQADQLLSQGLAIIAHSKDKDVAKQLLNRLVLRYKHAMVSMQQLPELPETKRLHHGYYRYFATARDLFSDYLAIQDNLFAKNPVTGRPVATELLQRKQRLEGLNSLVQELDDEARKQYHIAPYSYVLPHPIANKPGTTHKP